MINKRHIIITQNISKRIGGKEMINIMHIFQENDLSKKKCRYFFGHCLFKWIKLECRFKKKNQ